MLQSRWLSEEACRLSAIRKVVPWLVLGLLTLHSAVAEEAPRNPPCISLILNQIGEGLGVYTALNNAIGFSVSYGNADQGVTVGALVYPSSCGVAGIPFPQEPHHQEIPALPVTGDPLILIP